MCGRAYETYTEDELALRYRWEQSKRNPLGLIANFNLSPTQLSPIVRFLDGAIDISLARWGLIPTWAKDVASAAKYSLINARGEEIQTKRSYAQAFAQRRCILPVSGFYEWKRTEKTKRPFAIHQKHNAIMSIAGVWELWGQGKDQILSFSVVTTSANSFVQSIHDRMPVILDAAGEATWLDPTATVSTLQQLLQPCPPETMEAFEVSTLVNSPKNNRPELLKPLE